MIEPQIDQYLKKSIGLDASTLGVQSVERAIKRRMSCLGAGHQEEYLRILHRSDQELQELIESVIVPETWFFRDRQCYVYLANYIFTRWNPPHSRLKILSFPCSTGEEPYSIAITALEAGLETNRFQIDSFDISKNAIAKATRSIYTQNSFRTDDLDFRNRYFDVVPDGYQLKEEIRNSVQFRCANLLEGIPVTAAYDIIFCRNLLIYFGSEARKQAVISLYNALAPEGILFVGHAETAILSDRLFKAMTPYSAFVFRKVDQSATLKKTAHISAIPKREIKPGTPMAVKHVVAHKHASLKSALKFADEGRMTEAKLECEAFLRLQPDSADAYSLLGIIEMSEGKNRAAEAAFGKALYLRPDHYEALLHLALLKENDGDFSAAQLLRRRAERVKEKK